MATNNNTQQRTQLQASLGPAPFNGQQPSAEQPQKKKPNWTGFTGKTLWDWLNLIGVLHIPVMIAAGSILFSFEQNLTNQQIAVNPQRETLLKTYMDDITNLLLNYGLRESKQGSEVRVIATAKTLTTLRQLDGVSKGVLMQFLTEANLIQGRGSAIINLNTADLKDAQISFDYRAYDINAEHWYDLNGSNLACANLENAKLNAVYLENALFYFANLKNADLNDADLSYADLGNADLSGANLAGANLSHAAITSEQLAQASSLSGATMPDGSIHP